MSGSRLLDTNLLLRYLTRDDEAKARAALHLLLRVDRGEERVRTSSMVVFETIFTLQSFYRLGRERIRDRLRPILTMRGLELPDKRVYLEALDLYAERPFLSFADAFNVSYMRARGIDEIYSWDRDFDRVEGVTRVEPELPGPEWDDSIDDH